MQKNDEGVFDIEVGSCECKDNKFYHVKDDKETEAGDCPTGDDNTNNV